MTNETREQAEKLAEELNADGCFCFDPDSPFKCPKCMADLIAAALLETRRKTLEEAARIAGRAYLDCDRSERYCCAEGYEIAQAIRALSEPKPTEGPQWCIGRVEGCSGVGRPTCKAVECMLNVVPDPNGPGFVARKP